MAACQGSARGRLLEPACALLLGQRILLDDLEQTKKASRLFPSMPSPAGCNRIDYLLLSDSDASAVKAFGIAYKVDDATLARMKNFNVDLDAATGIATISFLILPC